MKRITKTCGECRFYHPIFKHEGVCVATSDLRKTCDFTSGCAIGGVYSKPPPTPFEHITASPEVLAPYLVFWEGGWTSRFIQFTSTNQEDAIAATVEKLKEVYNETTSN